MSSSCCKFNGNIRSTDTHSPVTRKEEREEILENPEVHVKIESLLNGKSNLNGIAITIEKGDNFSDMYGDIYMMK